MIKRLGEKQTWPAFAIRLRTAVVTASSKIASYKTIRGSFPPSSKTDFLTCFPADWAIIPPVLLDPVKWTP